MSTRFFPTISNVIGGRRRVSLPVRARFEFSLFGFVVLVALASGINGQRPKKTPDTSTVSVITMPDVDDCVDFKAAESQIKRLGPYRIKELRQESNRCPVNTVFEQNPKNPANLRFWKDAIELTVSTGPPQLNNNKGNQSVNSNSGNKDVTGNSANVTNVNKDHANVVNTNTNVKANAGTNNTNSNRNSNKNANSNSDTRIDDPVPPNEDFPWGWILAAVLVPISTAAGGQILRYQIWKKRISVEASVDEPNLEWISPLNPSFVPISMRVKVVTGDVRFDGPIRITKSKEKND
jgi:hypothetical protein